MGPEEVFFQRTKNILLHQRLEWVTHRETLHKYINQPIQPVWLIVYLQKGLILQFYAKLKKFIYVET